MARSAPTIEGAAALYEALAPIYDEWQRESGHRPFALVTAERLLPLLRDEARKRPRDDGGRFSFLDAGCGTGTLLSALRRAEPAWRLAGIDASGRMLAELARKPEGPSLAAARAAFDRPLPVRGGWDAVGVFYDALNHLTDAAALGRALASLAAVLRPGGWLAFDLTNEIGFECWWRGRSEFRGPSWSLSIDADFDAGARLGRALTRLERLDLPPRRFLLEEHCPGPATVQAALEAAGLRVIAQEPWAPFVENAAGKTWWVARVPDISRV